MKRFFYFLVFGLAGCQSIKPYEKEYLLHPFMDDSGLVGVTGDFGQKVCSRYERLSSLGGSASGTTSCPTCGG